MRTNAMFVSAGLAASVLLAGSAWAADRSYLILSSSSSGLPKNLAAAVTAAGGKVTATLPEVGLAVVTSGATDFAAKAGKVAGVRSVVANPNLQWSRPAGAEAAEAEVGNPPYSGSGDFFFDLQWGHAAIQAPAAWNAGYRGLGARVAVLDGGFDTDHPDLAPNIDFGSSTSFVPYEGLTYALPDPFSHGSHTAGTVAAADNGFGTIGVAPEATLILVKVLDDGGSGAFDWVIQGIVHAANEGAHVINMSLGAYLPKHGLFDGNGNRIVGANEIAELRVALGRATTYAYQKGVTIIASAGNSAIDGDHDADGMHLPSDCPHVLSISATTSCGWARDPFNAILDYPASYSNYGQSVISFAAPGGDICDAGSPSDLCTIGPITRSCFVFDLVFSTGSNLNPGIASYYWSAGTSMAAPHAAGVAALIVGKHGGAIKPAQVEAILRASADDLGKPGNDDFYGGGRVNAAQAVQ